MWMWRIKSCLSDSIEILRGGAVLYMHSPRGGIGVDSIDEQVGRSECQIGRLVHVCETRGERALIWLLHELGARARARVRSGETAYSRIPMG